MIARLFLALSLVMAASVAFAQGTPNMDTAAASDPFLWLEDVNGARAMDWVKAENCLLYTSRCV